MFTRTTPCLCPPTLPNPDVAASLEKVKFYLFLKLIAGRGGYVQHVVGNIVRMYFILYSIARRKTR